MTGRAIVDRAAILAEAQDMANDLASYAESLLYASNRLRDGSIQAHMEAYTRLRNVVQRAEAMQASILLNNKRWKDVA